MASVNIKLLLMISLGVFYGISAVEAAENTKDSSASPTTSGDMEPSSKQVAKADPFGFVRLLEKSLDKRLLEVNKSEEFIAPSATQLKKCRCALTTEKIQTKLDELGNVKTQSVFRQGVEDMQKVLEGNVEVLVLELSQTKKLQESLERLKKSKSMRADSGPADKTSQAEAKNSSAETLIKEKWQEETAEKLHKEMELVKALKAQPENTSQYYALAIDIIEKLPSEEQGKALDSLEKQLQSSEDGVVYSFKDEIALRIKKSRANLIK